MAYYHFIIQISNRQLDLRTSFNKDVLFLCFLTEDVSHFCGYNIEQYWSVRTQSLTSALLKINYGYLHLCICKSDTVEIRLFSGGLVLK